MNTNTRSCRYNLLLGALDADSMFNADSFDVDEDFWHHGLKQYRTAVAPHLLYARRMTTSYLP